MPTPPVNELPPFVSRTVPEGLNVPGPLRTPDSVSAPGPPQYARPPLIVIGPAIDDGPPAAVVTVPPVFEMASLPTATFWGINVARATGNVVGTRIVPFASVPSATPRPVAVEIET